MVSVGFSFNGGIVQCRRFLVPRNKDLSCPVQVSAHLLRADFFRKNSWNFGREKLSRRGGRKWVPGTCVHSRKNGPPFWWFSVIFGCFHVFWWTVFSWMKRAKQDSNWTDPQTSFHPNQWKSSHPFPPWVVVSKYTSNTTISPGSLVMVPHQCGRPYLDVYPEFLARWRIVTTFLSIN